MPPSPSEDAAAPARPRFTRISEIRPRRPADVTLQNLLELLHQKVQLNARLPVLAYEAELEGHAECAAVLRSVAAAEEAQILELFGVLREQLEGALETAEPTS